MKMRILKRLAVNFGLTWVGLMVLVLLVYIITGRADDWWGDVIIDCRGYGCEIDEIAAAQWGILAISVVASPVIAYIQNRRGGGYVQR